MYSTIFCHQTFYPSELFEKFEEVRCGRVWKQHKHGIGELRHVFYAWINTGSGQKGSVIVARINTGSGRNRLNSWASLSNSYPNACVPNREAVCTIYMMVFGMTQPRSEPTTYRMRSRQANH